MVSKAREDLPDPDTPVTTVRVLCGTSKSIFLRLWTRAPRTTMLSVCVELDIERAAAATPNPKRKRSEVSGWLTESFYYKGFPSAPRTPQRVNARKRDLSPTADYWVRSAATGSVRAARRAGQYDANNAVPNRMRPTATITK